MAKGSVYSVELSCGHRIHYPARVPMPRAGDTVLCLRCNNYSGSSVLCDEWNLRCQECKYGQKFGAAKLSCETAAVAHALKKNHSVCVYITDGASYMIEPKKQESLFDDVPAF